MTQAAPGLYLHLRLFLEGIEVPVISASTSATIGGAASGSVEIIPDDLVELLLPRTMVHVFYLDSLMFHQSGEAVPTDKFYKLFFAGELFGVSHSKAGMGSRSVTLNCLDTSNCLDTNYVYQFSPTQTDSPDNSIVRNSSRFLTTLDSTFDTIVNSPSEVIRQLSSASPSWSGSPTQQSVLGGLFAVLERLLGIQGNYYGTNGWITVQERRLRFLESIIADSGETAAKIYEATQFSGWLTKRLGQEGQVITFRRLVDLICEFIFYRIVPNPIAKYVRGESGKFPGKNFPNRDIPQIPTTADVAPSVGTFGGFLVKSTANLSQLQPQFAADVLALFTAVDRQLKARALPSGLEAAIFINRGFAADSQTAERSRHRLGLAVDVRFAYAGTDWTKKAASPEMGGKYFPFNLAARGAALLPVDSASAWYLRFRTAAYRLSLEGKKLPSSLPEFRQLILSSDVVFEVWNRDTSALDRDVVTATDWQAFAVMMRTAAQPLGLQVMAKLFTGKFDPVGEGLLGIGDDPVHVQYFTRSVPDKTVPIEVAASEEAPPENARERLHSFVFRPDIWFAPPPRSNVIFPDMLQSFSMQREMLRETTRLQLDVGFDLADGQPSTDSTFFAPQIVGQESLTSDSFSDASKILLYDHEKFSGVVPKFERMLDTMFFIEQSTIPDKPTDKKGALQEFAPKVAHYHLLSERYRARTASVGLTFSPHIICGFPAVVLDAIITADELKSKDQNLNRSFKLGMVESVSHSISQGGAQTQVRLTHVRSHRVGDKTDDLFTSQINREGEVSLTTQSATAPTSLTEFGCEAQKGWREEGADAEFGFRAIAAVFGFADIEDLVEAATQVEDPPAVIDMQEYTFGDVSADASASPRDVVFAETPFRKEIISRGSWVGSPTLVFLSVLGDLESSDTSSQTNSRVSVSLRGPTLPVSFLSQSGESTVPPAVTAFVVPSGMTHIRYIPLILPGSRFVPGEASSSEPDKIDPVEESLRPIWISEDYSAKNITSKIYEPFFGTSSITDAVTKSRYRVPSVEEAVDLLARVYAREVVHVGADSSGISPAPLSWIYEYTYRNVASLSEVLGSKTTDPLTGKFAGEINPADERFKYYGGFHSNAVNFGSSRYGSGLEFLDIKDQPLTHQGHSSGDVPFTLQGAEGDRLDPRAERAKRVLRYKEAIRGSEALRNNSSLSGIGKRG